MSGRLWRRGFVAAAAIGLIIVAGMASRSGASAQGPAISVSSLSSYQGKVGKAEVSISDVAAPGVGAWTIDVHFDPTIIAGVACTAEQPGEICNETYDENGIARVVGTDIYGLEGDATLASIGFSCESVGETSLEISVSVFVDATPGDPTPIDVETVNGSATCADAAAAPTPGPSKLAGDANCDGDVNALDAVLVLQYTVDIIDSFPCPDNADYNHDGVANALDAALILQKDAGLIP